jgi:Arabinose efflux permease
MKYNYFKAYKGLPISIYILFFASIINNMGQFVGPFLTMFLTFNIGMSVGKVGAIVAGNSAMGMLGALFGGKLIDSVGRKKIFVIFSFLSLSLYAICGFLKDPLLITLVLLFASLFNGFSQPVFSTIITDLTEGIQRNAAFSLSYIALNIGFSVGPLIAGFLYKNHLIWLFLGDALTTLISVILVMLYVPETKPEKIKISDNNIYEKAEKGTMFSILIKRWNLLVFSLIMVIYFIVFSQFNFGLSLQVGAIFGDTGAKIYGSLMTVNAVLCSTITVFITSLTKRLKSSLSISIGGLLYAVGFGIIYFINSFPMFILSTALWTAGEILVATNTSIYIAEHTPVTHRGRFNSIFPIIRKLGFIIGPLFAGIYIKYTLLKNLWILVSVLAVIGSFLMYKLYSKDVNKT